MKNGFWSDPWFCIPVLLFFNIGLLLQLYLPMGQEILYLNPWRTETLNMFFRNWTKLGEPLAFVVIGLVAMLWRVRYALLLSVAGLIVAPTSYVFKESVGKDRPITFFKKNKPQTAVVVDPSIYLNKGQTSFPSGHSMAAFCMYGLLALLVGPKKPWLRLACAITAILVAFSRVFLVQHFLADILAGAILGLAIASLVHWLDQRYFLPQAKLNRGLIFNPKQV